MPGIRKNKPTYNKEKFRRVLESRLRIPKSSNISTNNHQTLIPSSLADDNSDLLIYLIYIKYITELIKGASDPKYGYQGNIGEITEERLGNANEELMKKYQG